METLIFKISDFKRQDGIRIEPAADCDGSMCHQPIFREDGSLNFVPPHCHLVTRNADGEKHHLVLCDFPEARMQARPKSEEREVSRAEAAFAEYLSGALAEYLESERQR